MARYRDRDGDVWELGSDGSVSVVEVVSGACAVGYTLDSEANLADSYGPLVSLDAGAQPVSRAEFAEFLAELRDVTHPSGKAHALAIRWTQRMGGEA